jgi:adenylosuccinate synthase
MDVVIGAAFGDEGKGLMTHYLASRYGRDAIVVRFNGGAQAGHTVVVNDAKSHVFKHFGSGSFAGAGTFLSRFFVSNPILFLEEIKELQLLGLQPEVYVDPDSPVTTPYDMMINQIIEEFRDKQRHGSCGVGFAETIERNSHPQFSLTVGDMENFPKVSDTLQLIQRDWVPQRLSALGINTVSEQWQHYIKSEDIFQYYLNQLSLFQNSITVTRIDLVDPNRPLIFEGAQGLMLDQDRGWFPHVTRSHTGLKNIVDLLGGNNKINLNVIYVTRSYLTRHGAGPLPFEISTLPYKNVIDKTNLPNIHQGSLRYAWFNIPLLKSFIHADINEVPNNLKINPQLAVTCLDQVDNHITYVNEDKILKTSESSFLQKISTELEINELICSYSPSIDAVKKISRGY